MLAVRYSWKQAPSFAPNEGLPEFCIYNLDSEHPYNALSYSWDSECTIDTDEIPGYEDYALLTDGRADDKILVYRTKNSRKPNTGRERRVTALLERISVPVCNGNASLFRCSRQDLPDFIEWLNFQRVEDCSIYQQPSYMVLEDSEALSAHELSRCSSTISQLLQCRTIADLQLILLACYVVTNSYRELDQRELATAVYGIAKTRFPGQNDFLREEDEVVRQQVLFRILWSILRVKENLKVGFNEPSMKKFLQSVALPGVERGHGTMAQICLGEIRRFGDAFIVQPWHRFSRWFGAYSDWPLMRYASKYWSCHVQEASPSRPDITAQLFHIINHGVAHQSPSNTPAHMQRKVVEIGHSISIIYSLPCLTALYANLGAAGGLPLFDIPSASELQHSKLSSYQTLAFAIWKIQVTVDNKDPTTHVKEPQLNPIDIVPDFCKLRITSQGRPQCPGGQSNASVHTPEDLEWESVDQSDYYYSKSCDARSSDDSWTVVIRQDYDIQ